MLCCQWVDALQRAKMCFHAHAAEGGIDYMHSKGVMHRDIKAENVLLTEWSPTAVVKIIDFGIAARLVIGSCALIDIRCMHREVSVHVYHVGNWSG